LNSSKIFQESSGKVKFFINFILACIFSFTINHIVARKSKAFCIFILIQMTVFIFLPLVLGMITYNVSEPSTVVNIKMYLHDNYDKFTFLFKLMFLFFNIMFIFIPNKEIKG